MLIFSPTSPVRELLKSELITKFNDAETLAEKITNDFFSYDEDRVAEATQQINALGITSLPLAGSSPIGGPITVQEAKDFINDRKANLTCDYKGAVKKCLHAEEFSVADVEALYKVARGGFRVYVGINKKFNDPTHPGVTDPMCLIFVSLDASGKEVINDTDIREFGSPCPPNCPGTGGLFVDHN